MPADLGKTLADPVQELARTVLAGRTLDDTLRTVVQLAVEAVPRCASASIMLLDNNRVRTAAATGDDAAELDACQASTGTGPAIDAVRTGVPVRCDDVATDDRWRDVVDAARRVGLISILSLPLSTDAGSSGALNLYATTAAGFADQEPPALAYAGQASVTVANAVALDRAVQLAQNLTQALEHRDVIGQAKGILIAEQGVSADAAFEILRRASQRRNRKLYDLAAEIVAHHTPAAGGRADPHPPRPDVRR